MAEPTPGTVNPTPRLALAVAALFGGLAAWILVVSANAIGMNPPHVPWSAPIGLALVAALVGGLAYSTQQRIQVRRERMDPQRAVAFLVLGKASALAGALVAGGYLAYGLMFVARIEALAPRDRVIRSGLCLVAGVVLCVLGLLLERACRVPEDEDDDSTREGDTRG